MFQTALLYLVSWYKRQLHVTMIFIYMYYNHGGLIKACLVSVTLVILGLRSRQKTHGKIRCLCLRWVYFFLPQNIQCRQYIYCPILVLFVSVWLPKHLKIFKTMQVSGIILCVETAEWNITVIKQSFYTIN